MIIGCLVPGFLDETMEEQKHHNIGITILSFMILLLTANFVICFYQLGKDIVQKIRERKHPQIMPTEGQAFNPYFDQYKLPQNTLNEIA